MIDAVNLNCIVSESDDCNVINVVAVGGPECVELVVGGVNGNGSRYRCLRNNNF